MALRTLLVLGTMAVSLHLLPTNGQNFTANVAVYEFSSDCSGTPALHEAINGNGTVCTSVSSISGGLDLNCTTNLANSTWTANLYTDSSCSTLFATERGNGSSCQSFTIDGITVSAIIDCAGNSTNATSTA